MSQFRKAKCTPSFGNNDFVNEDKSREIFNFEKHLRNIERPTTVRNIQTVERKVTVPMSCHVNIPKPIVETHEKTRNIEESIPLTVERPYEIQQEVFNDRVVEIETPVTVLRPVFRKEVRELIKEVPKVITKTIDRVVEVPEIKYVDKFEEVPELEFHVKYIPKQQKDPKCINMKHPSKPASSREYIYESPTQPSGIHPQMYTPYGNATAFLDTYAPSPTAPGMDGYPSGPIYPPPYTPIVDIDVPVPIPVPVYYDVPIDVPIERPIPTPFVVGQRTFPVYKEEGEVDVEVFVPKPQYVRRPTPPHLRTRRGEAHVRGYTTLNDFIFHPLHNSDIKNIPQILPHSFPSAIPSFPLINPFPYYPTYPQSGSIQTSPSLPHSTYLTEGLHQPKPFNEPPFPIPGWAKQKNTRR